MVRQRKRDELRDIKGTQRYAAHAGGGGGRRGRCVYVVMNVMQACFYLPSSVCVCVCVFV